MAKETTGKEKNWTNGFFDMQLSRKPGVGGEKVYNAHISLDIDRAEKLIAEAKAGKHPKIFFDAYPSAPDKCGQYHVPGKYVSNADLALYSQSANRIPVQQTGPTPEETAAAKRILGIA